MRRLQGKPTALRFSLPGTGRGEGSGEVGTVVCASAAVDV